MDDCFQERLVYSESDGSEVDELTEQIAEKPTTPLSDEISSPAEEPSEIPNSNGNNFSEESDEENLNKSVKKNKKNARILSSDDENSDNESHVNQKDTQLSDVEPIEQQTTAIVRPSICDSDTKSSDDGNKSDEEIQPTKTVKKLKKKKKKKKNELRKRLLAVENGSESESNDEMKEKSDKKQKKNSKRKDQSDSSGSSKSGSGSGSGSNSGAGSNSDSNSSTHSNDQSKVEKIVKPREKTAQRMSAKMAENQMKEIQSESQRFARQLHVNIPYHKPKQHSLKEFLSRRSIIEQQEQLNSKPMPKAAVAIKMSGDELIQFMEHMNKRTKEAEEFFQDEEDEPNVQEPKSDESDDEDWTEKSKAKDEKPTETPKEASETASNECQESETLMDLDTPEMVMENVDENVNDEAMDQNSEGIESAIQVESSVMNSTEPNEPKESTSDATNRIEFHTERSELDDELDAMLAKERKAEILKLCIPTSAHVPKLKGGKGFVIDLETNNLEPMPTSGVDELFNRFLKSACVKSTAPEQYDIGIFQSDTGTVERHKFNINLDDNRKRDSKPGESLLKLRSELSQKIRENREKMIAQRLLEEKQQKQLDSEEEELCEEEQEPEQEPEMSENEKDTEAPNEIDQLMDLEAAEEEQSEQNDDSDPYDANSDDECENSDQNDAEATEDLDVTEVSKRRRILVMDDSDDETIEPSPVNAIATENGQNEPVSQRSEIKSADQSFDDTSKAMTSHDLSALESEILQLDSQTNAELNKSETSKLFQDSNNDYGDISESQLMALCSGSFATQHPDKPVNSDVQPTNGSTEQVSTQIELLKEATQSKPAFVSSDEEEVEKDESNKVKKKRKKQTLVYSDDEEDRDLAKEQDEDVEEEEEEEQIEDEEEDIGERYIEYDSDENEIEVELKKSDVKNKASEYLENEAELSESEWGSGDEDEKDEMNHYEAELGDLEQFDKNKLRDELERIRLREQIDDDAKALRILKERFIEEEDNGMERERKFRWKHLNNGDTEDQVQNTDQDATGEQNNSDDENEAEWRRIRYEREQLLKQQTNDNNAAVERVSVALEVVEQKSVGNVTSIFNSSRRISIINPMNNTSSKTSSPFLITKSDLSMSHLSRKSFLNLDSPILEKLASLSKTGSDGEAILNTAKGKGNYVFIATAKKDNSKRKSESENGATEPGATNPSKKSKLDLQKNTLLRPKTKAFFESLN